MEPWHQVRLFPVILLPKEKLVDTNGAGTSKLLLLLTSDKFLISVQLEELMAQHHQDFI